jgi:hypothetical protein
LFGLSVLSITGLLSGETRIASVAQRPVAPRLPVSDQAMTRQSNDSQ